MHPDHSHDSSESFSPRNRLNENFDLNSGTNLDPTFLRLLFTEFGNENDQPALTPDTFHDNFSALCRPRTAKLSELELEPFLEFKAKLAELVEQTCTNCGHPARMYVSAPLELLDGSLVCLIDVIDGKTGAYLIPDLDYLSGHEEQPYEPETIEYGSAKLMYRIAREGELLHPNERLIDVLVDTDGAFSVLSNIYDGISNDRELDYNEPDEDSDDRQVASGTYSYIYTVLGQALDERAGRLLGFDRSAIDFFRSEGHFELFDLDCSIADTAVSLMAIVSMPGTSGSLQSEPILHCVTFHVRTNQLGSIYFEEIASSLLGPVANFYPPSDEEL